jgi:tRNA-dihydrouridine synthase B
MMIILAPMSGVTDYPFRQIVRKYGQPSLVVSEMIASQSMIREIAKTVRRSCQDEGPMAVQLAGCDPEVIAQAARLNVDRGASLIDINMGCPAKKIAVNSYSGAALMRDEDLAERIFEKITQSVSVPVTVKMRKGWDDNHLNAVRLCQLAQKHGLTRVAIHGRTRCQFYQGQADWNFITTVCQNVSIPVIANGDIVTEEDAKTVLELTNAAGIMIGRGCYGRPWFLKQVRHFLETGEKLPPPPLPLQQQIVEEHFEGMLSYYGTENGIRLARKHLGWYSKGLKDSAEFRTSVFQMTDPQLILEKIRRFYSERCEDAPSLSDFSALSEQDADSTLKKSL